MTYIGTSASAQARDSARWRYHCAAPRRSQRGFGASVTATDDNNVELIGVIHNLHITEQVFIIVAAQLRSKAMFHVKPIKPADEHFDMIDGLALMMD